MTRLLGIAGAVILALGTLVPWALAAEDGARPNTGRVLISVRGNVSVPAGEQADAVIVIQGTATIAGDVNTIVVVDGAVTLSGATADTLVVVRGRATLADGTRILGDVRTLDASVDESGGTVGGAVRGLEADLTAIGLFLGPALILVWIGFLVAMIAAGLALVALGTRQVRAAQVLVRRELGGTLMWGLAALFLPPLVALICILTVVGLPLGLAILLIAWPTLAFVGYLFAAVMLGDWLVARLRNGAPSERPYLGAIVGVVLAQFLSFFPPLSFIVSFVGMGAVSFLAWRTFRGAPVTSRMSAPAAPPAANSAASSPI